MKTLDDIILSDTVERMYKKLDIEVLNRLKFKLYKHCKSHKLIIELGKE